MSSLQKHEMYLPNDTIAAIATPVGEGGISIIRISGEEAVNTAKKIFRSSTPKAFQHFKLHYGYIVHPTKKEIIDEVLLSVMYAPHSYTREDVVEVNCHGGIICAKEILDVILSQGVRLAEPGEFTKRAFLNGRIDLVQAESVVDIIKAKTQKALKAAVCSLKGGLSHKLEKMKEELMLLLSNIEAQIDFPEEDIAVDSMEEMRKRILEVKGKVDELLKRANQWHVLNEGIKVVIVGKPNVGKSSLLNFIAGREKAIVTEIPGTTRDVVECHINIGGVPFLFFDTAGIRQPMSIIEEKGVDKAKELIDIVDIILVLLDASRSISSEDIQVLNTFVHKNVIILFNKIDLGCVITPQMVFKILDDCNSNDQKDYPPIIETSVKDGTNIDKLEELLLRKTWNTGVDSTLGVVNVNARHRQNLEKISNSLGQFMRTFDNNWELELLAFDLRESINLINEILGVTVDDDVLNVIFSRFCIGK